MNYGITDKGFTTKTFDVLLAELFALWSQAFGAIDTDPDGAFGQIGNSLAFTHANVWQIVQDLWMQVDYRTAISSNLDRLVALIGVYRKSASKAQSSIYLGGANGTLIPEGTIVKQVSTNISFATSYDVTLNKSACNKFEVKIVSPVVAGQDYGFTLNGIQAVYEAPSISTPVQDICNEIISVLYANQVMFDISSAVLNSTNNGIIVSCRSPFRTFSLTTLYGVTLETVYNSGYCIAIADGKSVIPANSITTINLPSIVVTNPVNGSSGSDIESDINLRRRVDKATQLGSNATAYAIESKIWNNVENINSVNVYTNRSDVTDYWGNPPHSVQVVVDGGSDEDVATQIFNSIPVGINTYGDTAYSLTVPYLNDLRTIYFTRVKILFGWVKVIIHEKNTEEEYPTNAEDLMRKAIYDEALKSSGLGRDVIAQKFLASIYRVVSGLSNVEVLVSVTGLNTTDPETIAGDPNNYTLSTYSSGYKPKVSVAPTDYVEWLDAYNVERINIEDRTL